MRGLIVLVTCCLFFATATVTAQIIYQEDFDSYASNTAPPGWAILHSGYGSQYQTVMSSVDAPSSPNVYKLEGACNWAATVYHLMDNIPDKVRLDLKVRVETPLSTCLPYQDAIMGFFNYPNHATTMYGIGFAAGMINGAIPFTYGIWYNIRVELNKTSKSYSAWVNGQPLFTNQSYSGSDPNAVFLTAHNKGHTIVWYDDMRVYEVGNFAFCENFDDGTSWQSRWTEIYGNIPATPVLVTSPTHNGSPYALAFQSCWPAIVRNDFEASEGIYSGWVYQTNTAQQGAEFIIQSDYNGSNWLGSRYYEFDFSCAGTPGGGFMVLQRRENDIQSLVTPTKPVQFARNEWVKIFVIREGNVIRAGYERLNGEKDEVSYTDPNPLPAGKFIIMSCGLNESNAYFWDDVCYELDVSQEASSRLGLRIQDIWTCQPSARVTAFERSTVRIRLKNYGSRPSDPFEGTVKLLVLNDCQDVEYKSLMCPFESGPYDVIETFPGVIAEAFNGRWPLSIPSILPDSYVDFDLEVVFTRSLLTDALRVELLRSDGLVLDDTGERLLTDFMSLSVDPSPDIAQDCFWDALVYTTLLFGQSKKAFDIADCAVSVMRTATTPPGEACQHPDDGTLKGMLLDLWGSPQFEVLHDCGSLACNPNLGSAAVFPCILEIIDFVDDVLDSYDFLEKCGGALVAEVTYSIMKRLWDYLTDIGRTAGDVAYNLARLKCPTRLELADEFGNRITIDAQGVLSNEIPLARAWSLAEMKISAVPNSGAVYGAIVGLGEGTGELVLAVGSSRSRVVEIVYQGIPIHTGGRAKFVLANLEQSNLLLLLDHEGDGTFESSMLPSGTSDSGYVHITCSTGVGSPSIGVAVDVYNAAGHLVEELITNVQGHTTSSLLMAGTYTIAIMMPLGFSAVAEAKEVTVIDTIASVDFTLTKLDIIPNQKPQSYWITQIQKALAGTPRDYTLAQFSGFAAKINQHFNENRVNQVDFYTVPQPATQSDSLELLRQILTMTVPNSTEPFLKKYANAELLAVMLNVIAGKISQTQVISEDDRTVSQAITYCDYLINGIPSEMAEYIELGSDSLWPYRRAQSVAYSINTGQMVTAGKIPAEVADIAYRSEVRQPIVSLPTEFELKPNHPNPFNPVTTIDFSLPKASDVQLEIFNIAGQKVATLVNSRLEAGYHSVTWDSRNNNGVPLASGIYLYRLKAGDFVETKKMMLLK